MSSHDLLFLLDYAYDRALCGASPDDTRPIRRAFGRAIRALRAGDPRPAVLLVERWP